MKIKLSPVLGVVLLAASISLPTSGWAQDKRALAVKLAQLQHKADQEAITAQLTASAVQPVIIHWSQRLEETVPQARQQEVRDQLDVELKKFADATEKAVAAQTAKTAESALVPIFMEKLSEDELKTIIAYLESPASSKFQNLGTEAGGAWAKQIVDATKDTVERSAKTFDAAAERIVGAASTKGSGASAKKPAKK